MQLEVKNISGKKAGDIELDDAVFGAEVHEHLLWETVKWQLAKRNHPLYYTWYYHNNRMPGSMDMYPLGRMHCPGH